LIVFRSAIAIVLPKKESSSGELHRKLLSFARALYALSGDARQISTVYVMCASVIRVEGLSAFTSFSVSANSNRKTSLTAPIDACALASVSSIANAFAA